MEVLYKEGMKVTIKVWAPLNEVESGALDQAMHVASLPFIYKHVALMPDTHQGYGCPIGTVAACDDVVLPSLVGVDIGCGVSAFKTNVYADSLSVNEIKKIVGAIRESVPVGFKHHAETQHENNMPDKLYLQRAKTWHEKDPSRFGLCYRLYNDARRQVGTLGGGNHFIELQKDPDNLLWVMIHSGSRNLGKQVADHYNKMAIALNEKYESSVPKAWQLAFLPFYNLETQAYLDDMDYCVQFARCNRCLISKLVLETLHVHLPKIEGSKVIDVAHNYAQMEHHFGRSVMVHRKGATRAAPGDTCLIPGSQGTSSYVALGQGNKDSFHSCSHGAGRKISRSKAKAELDLACEIKLLDDLGIVHSVRTVSDLDEAAGAYKDITWVMEQQRDLVTPITELKPVAVVKG